MLKLIKCRRLRCRFKISKEKRNWRLTNLIKGMSLRRLLEEGGIIWEIGWNMQDGRKDFKNSKDVAQFTKGLSKSTTRTNHSGCAMPKWRWKTNSSITLETSGSEQPLTSLESINSGTNTLTWRKSSVTTTVHARFSKNGWLGNLKKKPGWPMWNSSKEWKNLNFVER